MSTDELVVMVVYEVEPRERKDWANNKPRSCQDDVRAVYTREKSIFGKGKKNLTCTVRLPKNPQPVGDIHTRKQIQRVGR
jgi:hypothetical protein